MKYSGLIICISLLAFGSCEKEDTPYALPPPGPSEQAEVTMGEEYDTQVYFNLADKKQYSGNLYAWELAFETGQDEHLIRMNGGKQVQVYNTHTTTYNQVFSISGINWQWDSPDGNADSAAFRDWYNVSLQASNAFVYLIDRGPDAGNSRYKKLQMLSVNAVNYSFHFSNLDGTEEMQFMIQKDTAFNFIFFSFADGGKTVQVEPGKDQYDILFTRYRYIYYDLFPVLPYSVNGVLINPYLTSVAADSITPYDSIDFAFAKNMTFSNKWDAIGFDWKYYDFNTSLYEVNRSKCYVIKNRYGIYYKLRFLDFYNIQGIKGSPEFEFQRL